MSRLGWFAAGLGLGALAVIQLRDNPKAQVALDEAIAAAKDFSQAVAAGYQEREAELTKPVAKPAAKPVAKPAAKPVAKPAAKPAAKKPVAKKPAARTATAKPAAKRAPTKK